MIHKIYGRGGWRSCLVKIEFQRSPPFWFDRLTNEMSKTSLFDVHMFLTHFCKSMALLWIKSKIPPPFEVKN